MELINNEHIQNISSILELVGERVEGNLICDIEPRNWVIHQNESKIRNIQTLCRGKKKIMEIGVNACHSLLIMLLINPDAEYLLFDLNFHRYTEPTLEYIKKQFPTTKINIIFGNSVDTIRQYIDKHPQELHTYDLIHLDGGHTEDIFSHDYKNSKQLLQKDGIVIFDDYNYIYIHSFIQVKLIQHEIVEYTDQIMKNNLHFVYKYV